jgi:hypothetical protein
MAELATRTNAQIRRSKRWRLAVIFAVAAAILSISLYVTRRHNDDIKAAQSDAAVVANQLPGQVAALDINAVFAAISADRVNGLPQNDFPGRPDIPGAELTQVSSTPDRLQLTYQISSHGQDICVTSSRTATSNSVSTSTGPCRAG